MNRTNDSLILILSFAGDLHGLVVAQALARKGIAAQRWLGADFGRTQRGSLSVGDDEPLRLELLTDDWATSDEMIRTVWARRPVFPVPPEETHAEDRRHVLQENCLFVQGAWWQLAERCQWINPYAARRYVKSKPMQLKVARELGLAIPKTLFSNDPKRVREFAAACAARPVLYKPHRVTEWREEGTRYLLHAALLPPIDEIDDNELSACAGIYQEYIPKAFELRIHVMGEFCLAVRINSQQAPGAVVDWRSAKIADLNVEPYALSTDIARQCVEFVRRCGLVFGIIDAIVTPDGKFVFLELNEMGQFLWVERANPEIRLLDRMCEFVASADPWAYSGHTSLDSVSYDDLLSDPALMACHAKERAMQSPDFTVEWIDVLI